MKITDKDRLDFLEKMTNLKLLFDFKRMKYKVQNDRNNIFGNTSREAIDKAIMAMREKDNV